jgi:lipopolysaccharide export system protein LptA
MEYNAVRQTVVFLGNVHVTRPDFELRSKKLTVFLKKKDGSDPSSSVTEDMRAGEVDRLVAENEVRLKSENRFGECEKATYYSDSDKVVMEGSPVLSNPDITIRGEVITHFLRENRTQVGKVVNATFQTPDRSAVQESSGQSTSSSGDR